MDENPAPAEEPTPTLEATETAQALVDRMVAAGEWPEPALLEAILTKGDEAVGPLIEVVRQDRRGWPDEAPTTYAIGLLGDLKARDALPALCDALRRYNDDIVEHVKDAAISIGPEAIEPMLEVARDRSLSWYPHASATGAAAGAAGDDPALRARVAQALRQLLEDSLARKDELEGEDFERVATLVGDLAELADPQARDLIKAAFEADIVEYGLIDEGSVDQLYRSGGRWDLGNPEPFLSKYRENYKRWSGHESRADPTPHGGGILKQVDPYPTVTAPIRNTEYRPGRNDLCWCGSGKKYKKCHLSFDEP